MGIDYEFDKRTIDTQQLDWSSLSKDEKNKQLFMKQKMLLDTFLERKAISQGQYNKSLGDLREKMGIRE